MKFKNKIYSFAFLAAFTIFTACDKNEILPLQNAVTNQAKIAVFNAIPGSPNIDVLANGTKINGNTVAFSARFPVIQYSLLTPGNAVIKTVVNTPLIIPTPVVAPNIPYGTELSSNGFNFLANKNYTIFVTGAPGGTTAGTVIEDVFPEVVSLKAHVKFVNAMPDGDNMDLLIGVVPTGATVASTFIPLFSNTARNTGSAYVAIDAVDNGSAYQFAFRNTVTGAVGTTTLILTALPGRLYTVYTRGFNTTHTIPGFTPARTVAAAPGVFVFSSR